MTKLTVSLIIAAVLPLSAWGGAVLEDELAEKLAEVETDELIHINLITADRVSPDQLKEAVEGFSKEDARACVPLPKRNYRLTDEYRYHYSEPNTAAGQVS